MTDLPNRQRGFTLLEVLVALIVLTVGATSLLTLFATASATHKRAVDRTHTALVAEEIFSEVQSQYHRQRTLEEVLDGLRQSLPEEIDGFSWEVVFYRPGLEREGPREGNWSTEWGEDELIVGVRLKWAEATRHREEVYWTVLLPR